MRKIEFVGKCLLISSGKEKLLVIGDLHFGYEEALNRTGVFVTRKLFEENIEYLDKVFERTGKVEKAILLGDVKHEFGRILGQERNEISKLLSYLKKKCDEIVIIKGNHDVILEPLARAENVKIVDYLLAGKNREFCFLHGDREFKEIYEKKIKYWIAGHGHPAVKISDGVKIEKYKCFLVGNFKEKKIIIVPSFFEGNVGSDPRENDLGLIWLFELRKFDVLVVSGEKLKVLNFGKLGKL